MQSNRFFGVTIRFTLVVVIVLLSTSFKAKHPYYIGMTEIRFDTSKKTVNTTCRMFTDDLQQALFKLYKKRIDLEHNDTSALPYLRRYMTERFSLTIGGKSTTLKLIGYEIEEEATWCYLETTPYTEPGQVVIFNTLLYDFLPEQTNFIHCYKNTVRKSFKLSNPETNASFTF